MKTEIITNNYKKVFPSRGLDPGKSNEGEVRALDRLPSYRYIKVNEGFYKIYT